MNKRLTERVSDNLEAEIISSDMSYAGIILNFSEHGLYMVTATTYNVVDITPSTALQLRCKLPSGEKLEMDCEVKWFQAKSSDHGNTFSMGMEILNPPEKYTEYLKQLK
ncbi:MAG: PilZ domain-containing protein [Nitrospira sp.]|nr:PilZ domain-containing protein [bacterium]MBL7049655.1 PilZ domain-containing protein [Nitrospira sp.]